MRVAGVEVVAALASDVVADGAAVEIAGIAGAEVAAAVVQVAGGAAVEIAQVAVVKPED